MLRAVEVLFLWIQIFLSQQVLPRNYQVGLFNFHLILYFLYNRYSADQNLQSGIYENVCGANCRTCHSEEENGEEVDHQDLFEKEIEGRCISFLLSESSKFQAVSDFTLYLQLQYAALAPKLNVVCLLLLIQETAQRISS